MENVRLIAERYAQALSQTVESNEELAEVRDELADLGAAVSESEHLRDVLASPIFAAEQKLAVMVEIAERQGASQLVRRFLRVAADHSRLELLPHLADAVARVHDQRAGIHEVEVLSAVPLESDTRARLVDSLERVAGGQVRVKEEVDPSLLGGLVARVGAHVYDGSLKARLRELRARMAGSGAGRIG
jgi:F-type H+-transporting ATPase subunit delta